jgi:hypothetical protein
MRRADQLPPDPEVTRGLEAIDAALAGQPVEPRDSELAQLALVLVADRPRVDPVAASALDEVLARRRGARPAAVRRRLRWWMWSPAAALVTGLVVAVVIVTQGGGSAPVRLTTAPSTATTPAASAGSAAAPQTATTPQPAAAAPPSASAQPSAPASSGPSSGLLQPPANGRKITQSAQLALTVDPSRVDAVAQEVYDVIGQAGGVVNSSRVTAGGSTGGYAQFQLSVPSAALPQTMAGLSSLRYAQVASRTDNTQDVNDEYQRDVRQLADARALRSSLLGQLAHATTQSQIDSLTARIHDAEASISSDEATLARLNHQVNSSQIALTINTGSVPSAGGGGFTLGKATHAAGRVLTVAAGVILIAAAGLVPLVLLSLLVWWAGATVRRRRREQMLDLA